MLSHASLPVFLHALCTAQRSFFDWDKDYRAFLEEETVCTPLGPDGPVVSPEVNMRSGGCITACARQWLLRMGGLLPWRAKLVPMSRKLHNKMY
ncbi:uncharacterized protein LOC122066524 isoform X2 [Macadamia integrifolia]|uniref:uncharacterized protein LOC122066524 isoform X2 n=1 Tax=Macadamia integrifolia TaxID=60698 RepID=UPI001C4FC1E7|nr:uncharacterized protein LOC122066524 isoform X2 [Macadamia integrifolia]